MSKAAQNSPKLSLLKFLPLTYHHSHFLATTLDFTSFFTIAFLRTALFFSDYELPPESELDAGLLTQSLSRENYVDKFHTLLYYEEHEHERVLKER